MEKILKTVRKLDDSKFEEIKRQWTVAKARQVLHDNMWSMFDLDSYMNGKYKPLEDQFIDGLDDTPQEKLSVTNFAWTRTVADEFYNHPFNKVGVRKLQKIRAGFEMFKLDCEPGEVDN